MEDFIRVWDNGISDALCDRIVKWFDDTYEKTPSLVIDEKIKTQNTTKNYLSCFIDDSNFHKQIYESISKNIDSYLNDFGHLKTVPLVFEQIKVKKINPYGGYHAWHYETNTSKSYGRELVWMAYLNDMPVNEAETEFLYQKRKIQPKKGRLVIFPACMTHVHRGLTVYSYPKYIVSGWIHRDFNKQKEMNE